ncbi:MAG TPA: hypothetical protein VF770_07695, partial [Solirubrobacterales bacterium]
PAVEKVLATIGDEELAARYPDRAHFISAGSPHQGEMATRALFAGDPVVIAYPDGHELLMLPEHARGIVAVFLSAAAFFLKHRRRRETDVVQLPPRARIEARDATGHPIAA